MDYIIQSGRAGKLIFLPVQSVGVMGDERTYENAVVLGNRIYRWYDHRLGTFTL